MVGTCNARVQRDLLKEIARVKGLGDDADKEAEVKELKRQMNEWTASYRTDRTFGGRPSFSNMYSAVNALAGHWNSFGADAPIPKKRLTRIDKAPPPRPVSTRICARACSCSEGRRALVCHDTLQLTQHAGLAAQAYREVQTRRRARAGAGRRREIPHTRPLSNLGGPQVRQ